MCRLSRKVQDSYCSVQNVQDISSTLYKGSLVLNILNTAVRIRHMTNQQIYIVLFFAKVLEFLQESPFNTILLVKEHNKWLFPWAWLSRSKSNYKDRSSTQCSRVKITIKQKFSLNAIVSGIEPGTLSMTVEHATTELSWSYCKMCKC